MTTNTRHSSSFRDPSGYIFIDEGILKRSISPIYFKQYEALKKAKIFENLSKAGVLIPHTELSVSDKEIVIQPEQIPFITYPYEWSFNQYKEAALLTLKLQKYCLEHGFSLKDATAFNITFHKGKAVFVDTLSFDFYEENTPWRAYKQFITHFLGPLVLAHFHGAQSLKLMSNFIDGIPVNMLSSMLPFKTKLNPFLYSNIHLLAKFEDKHNEDYKGETKQSKLSKKAQLNIITSLYDYIKKLSLKEHSEWGNYYDKTNYSDAAFIEKANIINNWVTNLNAKSIIDVGGNDGTFVRQINHNFELALVCDIDNNAVDFNHKTLKSKKESNMLPFVLDALNPSPAVGFENKERQSFIERITKYAPDVTLALAVIHHMTLSGNVPFEMSAHFFASFSEHLIIEFPKREDSWVQRLLNTKGEFKAHFDFYTIANFESCYLNHFELIEKKPIENSHRVMFLLRRKSNERKD
ncbi:spermine/spermidine synthase domain-containing protein [Psychroserpens ponticola]|uniref:Class I SAM-dependent methyltransferase n=1 Tax=Psychroserpens ponticola TaxID=2932268 RepID=A0ABY7RV39_9FLAO|nr:class I SAM-dependent methyltransferase [Psychroserpens ponticola]WCO00843.1 class I SAM-dependent methyltransferase [Psychroserpens ponticola]